MSRDNQPKQHKKRSVNSISSSKKEKSSGKTAVLSSNADEIKKLLVQQTKVIMRNVERFFRCRSEQNCELLNQALNIRFSLFTSQLIKKFDKNTELKKFIEHYQSNINHKVDAKELEKTLNRSVKSLGLSTEEFDKLAEEEYKLLLEFVEKFRNRDVVQENEESIVNSFHSHLTHLIFKKIYKNDNLVIGTHCRDLPEFIFVGDHKSCKINPDDECCYFEVNPTNDRDVRSVLSDMNDQSSYVGLYQPNIRGVRSINNDQLQLTTNSSAMMVSSSVFLSCSVLFLIIAWVFKVVKSK